MESFWSSFFFFPSSWKREGAFSFLFINFLDFFVFLGKCVDCGGIVQSNVSGYLLISYDVGSGSDVA